jgi:hypothetical protein
MKRAMSLLVCIAVSMTSGAIGAALWNRLHSISSHPNQTIQTRRLELVDSHQRVKAVFAAEDKGEIYLRMLSDSNVPVVEIKTNEVIPLLQGQNRFSSGAITLRDDYNIPIIDMRELNKGDGQISFSNSFARNQVMVGYDSASGCTVGADDEAMWGIRVKGANNSLTSMGVFTVNGVPKNGPWKLTQPPKLQNHK